MQITTENGKTFEARYIGLMLRNGKKVLVEIVDDRPLAEIAADFDGAQTIVKTDSSRGDVKTTYEGFVHLTSIARAVNSSTVRLSLESDKEG